MARENGKNNMRTAEEKEKIVLEYLAGNISQQGVADKYNIVRRVLQRWINAYLEKGIDGLKSKTGTKCGSRKGRPKKNNSEIDKLKEELLKKEIEIDRLKKGYLVKGDGARKEYVTTFDVNME